MSSGAHFCRRRLRSAAVTAVGVVALLAPAMPALIAPGATALVAGAPAAGSYESLPSARVLDTTSGLGAPKAPLAANASVAVTVAGQGGVPASGVASVVLNITAKASTAAGALTAYPTGAAKPAGANLTFPTGKTVSNLVTVALGTSGRVTITNTSTGTTSVTADVLGYFDAGTPTAAGTFTSLPSARVLDTTTGVGAPAGPVPAHATYTVTIAGHGGIPASGAASVVLNLTAKASTAAGSLTIYPGGATKPAGANLTFTAGATVSNLVTVAVGNLGRIKVVNSSGGTTAITADVLGYFLSGVPAVAGAFTTVPAARVLDTTTGTGAAKAPVAANGTVTIAVAGHGGIPASGATAVVLNVTAKSPKAAGSLTTYPAGAIKPVGANLTFTTGATVSSLVTVALGTAGQVSITNGSTGTTAVTADVLGYFLAGSPAGPDTTPPGPVSAVSASGSGTTLTLSWTNPTDADFAGVMVRRAAGSTAPSSPTSGTLVADVPAPGTSVIDNALAADTQYSYALFAHDAVPNSAAGASYTYTPAPPPPPTTVPSPILGGWQLNGAASIVSNASPANLQVTPATNWVSGSAFWPTPVPGAGVTAAFDAFIGPGSGADGMTFTLADASVTQPTALGDNGGGEGFSGLTGFALSLDTWQNTTDPSSNFIGIATTSAPVQSMNYVTTNSAIASLINTVHHFVVTTSVTGIVVTMDGTQVLNYATTLPPYVLVGFTAATGGFNDTHQVSNVSITAGSPPAPPTVTTLSPNSGPSTGGSTVTITGTNFFAAGAVKFGGNQASFTVNNATSITATAPAGTATVDVTVTTGAGTSAPSANDQFTYLSGPPPPPPAPAVTGVSPSSGSTTGGTSVTITGTHFTGASVVNFGPNAAVFSVDSDTSITATAPPGSGNVDVRVTTGAGASTSNPNDQFSYVVGPPLPPSLVSVDPVNGPAGSLVTLGGNSFSGATAVHFGSSTATFTVNNDSTITATAPAGTGTVDVTVTTAAGTSPPDSDTQFTYTPGPPAGSIPSPNAGGWQLNGSAQLVANPAPANLQLTPATNWLAGSAFYPTPVPGAGVTAAFDAFIGPGAGADGLTFTLADASVTKATALGNNGGGEGFAGINGIAVSLDHWQNSTDPSSNFVGIATASPSAQSLTYVTTNSSIPSLINTLHHFKVTTSSLGLVVTMDGTQVLNYGTSLPPYVLLGFTAANGGFNDVHQIQNVSITAGPPPPVPTITSLSPSSGPSTGATTVAITGSGLTSTSAVKFGSTPATAFLMQNDNIVTATAPAGKLGAVDVTITTAGGTTATSLADKFTYTVPPTPTVTSVSPPSGPSTGGTAVTVTGTGFAGTSAVNFGPGNPAIFFTVDTPTSMTVTAPTGPLGLTDITVTTPGGTSTTSAADRFTYTVPPAPVLTSVSPTSGPNGTFVTITGTSFAGATAVKFGPNASTFTINSPTSISATAPAGSGTVDVTVTTPGGTTPTHQNDHYTYTVPSAPTVTSVSPSSGFGGYSLVVTGTNFTGASGVNFGPNAASFTVNSDTGITATAPSGAGTVDVTVTTSGGVSTIGSIDQFTYLAGPPPPSQVATYRGDLGRSGYYPSETGVTTANATTLKKKWTAVGGTGSFAQPIVANNLVYWGDWSGFIHATDLAGHDVWTLNVGVNTDASCSPSTAGISGTVTIGQMGGTSVVYVPGGDNNMYALNALTGALIWKTSLGTSPAWYLWSSPVLFNGSLYEGISSFGDCPLVQGQLAQLDATTGAIQHVANMVPNGCIGAGIWTSPTVDPSDGSIYVTTGTPNSCHNPGDNLAPAIVKLRASDLAILSSWTVPASLQQFGDEDFGGTPTLFTATINGVPRALVGALNKDGLFFAWDRGNLAAGPVWQSTIADPSGSPRSIVSASWDGKYLYVGGGGAIINGASCYGNIDALDPATGAFIWRSCQTSFMTAGLTEVPGLLIEGVGAGGQIKFLNTANGATVFTFNTGSTVQGEVTVSNGIVYVPLANGNLIALGQ